MAPWIMVDYDAIIAYYRTSSSCPAGGRAPPSPLRPRRHPGFKEHDDILDEMTTQCGTLGPRCVVYLGQRYDSASLSTAVNNIGGIVNAAIIGPDSINAVATANKRYPALALGEDVLVALILLNQPIKPTSSNPPPVSSRESESGCGSFIVVRRGSREGESGCPAVRSTNCICTVYG